MRAWEGILGAATGCYTTHAAIEMYAEAFDSVDALDRLEAFASFHGPDFYGLPRNTTAITLEVPMSSPTTRSLYSLAMSFPRS